MSRNRKVRKNVSVEFDRLEICGIHWWVSNRVMNATSERSIKMPHEVNSAALSVYVCHAYNCKLHTMEQTTSSAVLTVAGTEK